MLVTLHRRFDLLAAPNGNRRPVARERWLTDLSQGPKLPAAEGSAAATLRRALSLVDAVIGASWLRGGSVDQRLNDEKSLAASERSRAALRRVQHQIAADRDAWTSHVGAPAYPVGRGEHP